MNDDFGKILTDLQDELTQAESRLLHEIAGNGQVKELIRPMSTSVEKHIEEQTRALTALYQIMMAADHAESLEMLLDEVLVQAMESLGCDTGVVIVFEDVQEQTHSSTARVIVERSNRPGMPHKKGTWLMKSALLADLCKDSEPLLIHDMSQDARTPEKMRHLEAQLLLAPIQFEGQIHGVVALMRPDGTSQSDGEMMILSSLTNQIGAAVQRLELRKLAEQDILLAERERLGRELHDTITQSLYGLAAMAEAGEAQLDAGDSQSARHTLKRIGQTSRQALREMRLFIHELRPGILEQNGLVAALHLRLDAVEGRTDTQTRLVADGTFKLPPEVENVLYRIAMEALNNSMRHAGASNVTVLLQREGNEVLLEVADDGCGFDPQQVANGGMGLENMTIYANEIGAEVQVNSAPAQGTTIRVAVTCDVM